jgi:hypothetical protein
MEKWHHAEAAEERSFFGEEIARNARRAMWDGRPRPSWSAPVPLKEVASATMNFAIFAHWLTEAVFHWNGFSVTAEKRLFHVIPVVISS